MDIQTLTSSPRNERGDGQVSHLLLAWPASSRMACSTSTSGAAGESYAERHALLSDALSGPLAGHLTALTTNAGLHIATLLQTEQTRSAMRTATG
jgi:hypothetical protein